MSFHFTRKEHNEIYIWNFEFYDLVTITIYEISAEFSLVFDFFEHDPFDFFPKRNQKRSFVSNLCDPGRECKREQGRQEDRAVNEGGRSLCTSLIQHCQGSGFYFSFAEEGIAVARHRGAPIYKRRVLFCKCAPGN